MVRLFRLLALACLANMTLVLSVLAAPRVWIAVTEEGGPYAEVAAVLKSELAGSAEVGVGNWQRLFDSHESPPNLIVTVGVGAFDGALERLAPREGDWTRVPVVATLLPQAVFEARMAAGRVMRRPVSAVVLDQPLGRQLALIKRVLPERQRIGILPSPQTRALLPMLEKEAALRGLRLVPGATINFPDDLYPTLKSVLEGADVILALPDAAVFQSGNLQNILLTTYRARVPLVAFSPAYVKAGAVLALYATPPQIARRAAELVRDVLAGRALPPPQHSREFTVGVNAKVAASLGVQIDDPTAIAEDLRRQQP